VKRESTRLRVENERKTSIPNAVLDLGGAIDLQESLGNSFKVNNPFICFSRVIVFCILVASANEIRGLDSCNFLGSSTFESFLIKSSTSESLDSSFDASQDEIFVENIGAS
jgi:hypothetical protein